MEWNEYELREWKRTNKGRDERNRMTNTRDEWN